MSTTAEALWLRALHVARARGLLPANPKRLTPGELAAEVARRGEDRLARLVNGWYYPASYGHGRGTLSEEEASGIVATLEAGISRSEFAPADFDEPAAESPPPRHRVDCELCGSQITLLP